MENKKHVLIGKHAFIRDASNAIAQAVVIIDVFWTDQGLFMCLLQDPEDGAIFELNAGYAPDKPNIWINEKLHYDYR